MIDVTEEKLLGTVASTTGGRDLSIDPITQSEAVRVALDLFADARSRMRATDEAPFVDLAPLVNVQNAIGPDEVRAMIDKRVLAHGEAIARQRAKIDGYISIVSGALTAAIAVAASGGANPSAIASALLPVVEVVREIGGRTPNEAR